MTAPATPLFSDAMVLQPVEGRPGEFDGNLNEHWTIGPKVHGGVMIALCAKAAREAYADPAGHAVAVSANFLSAPDPGDVRLVTAIRKRGRRIGLVDVELIQGDRACVHAVVTLGAPEHDAEPRAGERSEASRETCAGERSEASREPRAGERSEASRELLFADTSVARLMSPEPPADVLPIGPGHSAAEINHLARGCDIRPLVVEALEEGRAPAFQVWVRPREGVVDELFALMCGDISLPVPYAVGRRGWAPTVQLTAYLRGFPADGWLRVLCTATQIGQDWFDEDHTVIDSTGRIVVQTRQLALVPPG
jgi:hypothetical protein